jgi:hypothetical protein
MSPRNSDERSQAEAPPAVRTSFPTFARIGRRMKVVGKVFAVLIVIGMLMHGIVSVIEGRKLEADLRAIKAKGEPVSWAELGKPKVPDAENAAPAYAKVFSILTAKKQDPAPDVSCDLLDPVRRKTDPGVWEAVRNVLTKYQAIFPLIEEATSKPRCRFPIKWEEGFNAKFPQLASLRTASAMLAARAILQVRSNDMAGACHSIELGFKVSNALEEQPTLISQLVRIAVISIQARALREVMAQGDMTEAQARSMYDLLGGIDLVPAYVASMQTERLCGIWAFDQIRHCPEELMSISGSGSSENKPNALYKPLVFLWRPLSYMDERYYLRYMDGVVANAAMTYREVETRHPEVDREPKQRPRYFVMSAMITPYVSRARIRRDSTTAEIAGSRIALALTAYKARFGAYPASLAELRSKLGWEIPADLFSGKDFIYKRQGSGFLLYSMGQNLKDDGARVFTGRNPPEGYDHKDDNGHWAADIVWRMNH